MSSEEHAIYISFTPKYTHFQAAPLNGGRPQTYASDAPIVGEEADREICVLWVYGFCVFHIDLRLKIFHFGDHQWVL